MRSLYKLFILLTLVAFASALWAWSDESPSPAPPTSPTRIETVTERVFAQEAKFTENMRNYSPLVETYIQRLRPDNDLWTVPDKDRYFLGRLVLDEKRMNDHHLSFMQMIYLNQGFDKDHYDLKYVRQQFLGEVRTLVFDVIPHVHGDDTRFQGRIWVEDQDYNIVRINGT